MGDFSHLNEFGEAVMVDVSPKPASLRRAVVKSRVAVSSECAERLTDQVVVTISETARVAAIQAAKQTAFLIPLCHQIALTKVSVAIFWDRDEGVFLLEVESKALATTGVEMEAIVAAHMGAATIYDMIKAIDPEAIIGPTLLCAKSGGKLGDWTRENEPLDAITSM